MIIIQIKIQVSIINYIYIYSFFLENEVDKKEVNEDENKDKKEDKIEDKKNEEKKEEVKNENENEKEKENNEEKKEEKNDNNNNIENKEKEKENINQIIDLERKIKDDEVKDAPTLILEEVECNILNGQKIKINAQGMVGGRGMKDGVAIFGSAANLSQSENTNFNLGLSSSVNTNILKVDFILNLKEKYNYPFIFMIYFDPESKSYFIRSYSSKNNDNRIIYIKLTNGYRLPLKQKEIILAGNVVFQINPLQNNVLEIINLSSQDLSSIPKRTFDASSKKEVTIGRNKDCDFAFPNNKSFSRFQTTFEFDEENQEWVIIDGSKAKSSTNGTWAFCTHSFPVKDKMIVEILSNRIQISEEIKNE